MERDIIHLQCTVKKYTDLIQHNINLAHYLLRERNLSTLFPPYFSD